MQRLIDKQQNDQREMTDKYNSLVDKMNREKETYTTQAGDLDLLPQREFNENFSPNVTY